MRSRTSVGWGSGSAAVGALLVVVGVGWMVARDLRVDPFGAIGEAGWPFFVIVPGVVLMLFSLVPEPPRGVGFAIAGSIVTTVGLVLLYHNETAHWESWSYAWALVGPGAAGIGMLLYGLIFGQRDLVSAGARLAAIAAVLFVIGYWFFETFFATGRAPVDLGAWWPVVIIVAGFAVLAIGLVNGRREAGNERPAPAGQGGNRS